MQEDKLKKFITDHRAEFDDQMPSPRIWKSIESSLPVQGTVRKMTSHTVAFKIMKLAAGVCLLLLAGAGGGMYLQQQKYGEAANITNQEYRKEYLEATTYFTNQIDSKLAEIQQKNNGSQLLEDLNQIDQVSADLKLEILKNPDQDKDELIKQMIRQYQHKLNTLNKILEKLDKTNATTNQPSTIQPTNHDTLQL
jgi:hypothetical protein